MASALDLLALQIASFFTPGGPADRGGRQAVLAQSNEGLLAVSGPLLPMEAAQRIGELAREGRPQNDVMTPPMILAECEHLLERSISQHLLSYASGPTYLVTEEVKIDVELPILRSVDTSSLDLGAVKPENWKHDEWRSLIDGELGPWAMALDGDEIVSLCHTPALSPKSADAGTWTREDMRGRGLAAATVAAWAPLIIDGGRIAFYSTSTTNQSSQRVAERLHFPLLGTLWWFGRDEE